MKQQTIANSFEFSGIGVHSGRETRCVVEPLDANAGIVFKRADLGEYIEVKPENIILSQLCTTLQNKNGAKVNTIEHLMSAFYGMGIDNALVSLYDEEMPIMDGSALPFVEMIESARLTKQDQERNQLRVLELIEVREGEKFITVEPATTTSFYCEVDYSAKGIPAQQIYYSGNDYKNEVSKARTFGFAEEIEQLRAHGLARGGSLENAVGIGAGGTVLNPEGLRYQDELVRHKLLDLMGDLYLSGKRIVGKVHAYKASHKLHSMLVQKLCQL